MGRIERAARAIARARCGYEDYPPEIANDTIQVLGQAMMVRECSPAWKRYEAEAQGIVAVLDALRGALGEEAAGAASR